MAGFPGSSAPFRPLNPWGRAMPKVPQRKGAVDEPLYQIEVTNRAGKAERLGPQASYQFVEMWLIAIKTAIAMGGAQVYSEPRMVRA